MYKVRNSNLVWNFVLIGCMIASICMLSIGYAALTSKDLIVSGNVVATQHMAIFISDAQYSSSSGADVANSKIVDYIDTTLHSDIFLSKTDGASTITYGITIFNNSDATKKFTGVTYSEEFYSNPAIGYRLTDLAEGDLIQKGEGKTFYLTFYYTNTSDLSNNELDSFLNFNFDYYFGEETDVDVVIKGDGSYEFAGVGPDNQVNLADIANIKFDVINGNAQIITALKIDVTYTTSTGSKQSGKIDVMDEAGTVIATQTMQFLGKQTNAKATLTFSNITIETSKKLLVSFDQQTITNGQVQISGVTITPIFRLSEYRIRVEATSSCLFKRLYAIEKSTSFSCKFMLSVVK